mmetsp:Transcript_36149/g.41931  ORF Transcript_36149/g.41931 Transcript_36149/m.41931 type:complete len:93 (+) Transcript_36149:3-281(+)
MARQAKRRKATTRKGGESPVDLPMDETNKAKGNNNNVSSAESTNNYQGWRIPVRTNGETESTSTSTSTRGVRSERRSMELLCRTIDKRVAGE